MMKRILVLSDTHRHTSSWKKALDVCGPIDMVFHLGDNVDDAADIADTFAGRINVIAVRGNCDYSGAEDEEIITVCQKRLWLTHGHRYSVKYSIDRICYAAAEKNVDAVLFGHTHVPLVDYYHGILVLNPGSAGEPRRQPATCAVLEVSEEQIYPRMISLPI